jgi:hypothetical protein
MSDSSESVMDASGSVVDASGSSLPIDASGSVVDASGSILPVDGSGSVVDASGNLLPVDISGTQIPLPPPTLTLADILATQEVLVKREADDKSKLEAIGQLSIDTLRPKLIAWAVAGFPNNYAIHELSIVPPACCSDGVTRGLADYIVFCSGKSLSDHIAPLQTTLPDITVTFTFTPPVISIVVIKA